MNVEYQSMCGITDAFHRMEGIGFVRGPSILSVPGFLYAREELGESFLFLIHRFRFALSLDGLF